MLMPKQSESGPDQGRWYMLDIMPRVAPRRAGYCATRCSGHVTRDEAVEHHLEYQLDRDCAFWLDRRVEARACEICGEPTTLRARLGRKTELYVLCSQHQRTTYLRERFRQRVAAQLAAVPAV